MGWFFFSGRKSIPKKVSVWSFNVVGICYYDGCQYEKIVYNNILYKRKSGLLSVLCVCVFALCKCCGCKQNIFLFVQKHYMAYYLLTNHVSFECLVSIS